MATKAKKPRNMANPKEVLGAFSDELGDLGKNTLKSFNKDFVEGSGRDFMSQLLGITGSSESAKPSGEKAPEKHQDPTKGPVEIFNAAKLTPAEIAERQAHAKKEKKSSHAEAAIHYGQEVRDAAKKGMQKEKQHKRSELEQVQTELRQIVKQTSQESQAKYAPYTLTDLSREATVYQTSFLQQVLKGAALSKEKAAESSTWLNAAKGKGAKRGDFSLANGKMHQSGERTTVQNAAG